MGKESNSSQLGRTERYQGLINILKLSAIPFVEISYTKFTEVHRMPVVKKYPESLHDVVKSLGFFGISGNATYYVLVPKEITWAHENILDFAEGQLALMWIVSQGRGNEEFFACN